MKLSTFGKNKSIYELMSKIFPGVVFGAFHLEKDKKTLEVNKTSYWIDIEKKFFEVNTPSEFLDYLCKYTASGKQRTFEHLFLRNIGDDDKSLYIEMLKKLENPDELSLFLNDCRIVNDCVFKGGIFLYCARLLDAKFLVNLLTDSEIEIYQELRQNYNNDNVEDSGFPGVSLFNCNRNWGSSWVCEYDFDRENDGNLKYRFLWEKDKKNKDWGVLNYYSVNNPYELFIHMDQSKYTLANIGLKGEKLSLVELNEIPNYASEGNKEIYNLFKFKYQSLYKCFNFKGKIEENQYDALRHCILMGIERKDGAKNFEPSFFIPKDFDSVKRNVYAFIKHKEGLRRVNSDLMILETTEVAEVLNLFFKFQNEICYSSLSNDLCDKIKAELEFRNVSKNCNEKLDILARTVHLFPEEDRTRINKLYNTLISKVTLSLNKEENLSGPQERQKEIEEKLSIIIDDIYEISKRNNLLIDCRSYEIALWNDFEETKSIKKIYKAIVKYDEYCADSELRKNYLVSLYMKHDKSLSKITILLNFRTILSRLREKIKYYGGEF